MEDEDLRARSVANRLHPPSFTLHPFVSDIYDKGATGCDSGSARMCHARARMCHARARMCHARARMRHTRARMRHARARMRGVGSLSYAAAVSSTSSNTVFGPMRAV